MSWPQGYDKIESSLSLTCSRSPLTNQSSDLDHSENGREPDGSDYQSHRYDNDLNRRRRHDIKQVMMTFQAKDMASFLRDATEEGDTLTPDHFYNQSNEIEKLIMRIMERISNQKPNVKRPTDDGESTLTTFTEDVQFLAKFHSSLAQMVESLNGDFGAVMCRSGSTLTSSWSSHLPRDYKNIHDEDYDSEDGDFGNDCASIGHERKSTLHDTSSNSPLVGLGTSHWLFVLLLSVIQIGLQCIMFYH